MRVRGRLALTWNARSRGCALGVLLLAVLPGHRLVAQEVPQVASESGAASTLDEQFRYPPPEARPLVWWHWLNGNITQEGIAQDLAWMKRIGLGGAQTFDAVMQTPQIVDQRLPIFSPQWNAAMRFAASEASRLDLELGIAGSPGWTESGGPWVPPADGLKKLVWSIQDLHGGKAFAGHLSQPPSVTGPYQSIPSDPTGGLTLTGSGHRLPVATPYYRDIAVVAWPLGTGDRAAAAPAAFHDGAGGRIEGKALTDEDLTSAVDLDRPRQGAPMLVATYAHPVAVQSARLFVLGGAGRYTGGNMIPELEASEDGQQWRAVANLPLSNVPTTVSFPEVVARQFRIVFKASPKNQVSGFVPPVAGLDMAALGRMLGSGGSALGSSPSIRVAEFRLLEEARVDRAETKAGFDIAEDYRTLSHVPDAAGIPAGAVIDLTSRMRTDGTLDWAVPRGRWRVARIGWSLTGVVNHPASPEATGLEVDKYDGAAVRRYMEQYLGRYRSAVGPELIGSTGIKAIVNDSIESGPANWTPDMFAQFRKRRGYDPAPWIPALTGTIVGSREQSDRFLFDWRQTLSDLISSEHYGTIAQVARENGLRSYGEALENRRPSFGDDMAMRSHADIPMAALWTFPRERGPAVNYLADIKGAASVASIYGRRIVAAESMTSLLSPWAFGPRDLKRVMDLAFVSGVNRPVIHTSVHSPAEDKQPGLSLFIFGQYFNRHESWAELARPWVEYISRNAMLLQQGRTVVDLAYFYGEEAPLTGLYSDQMPADAPKGLGYDFINADALLNVVAVDGNDIVTAGGARYKAIYLGGTSARMSLPVLRKIASLVDDGGTIIGQRPSGDPGLGSDPSEYARLLDRLWPGGDRNQVGKGRVIVSSDPEGVLATLGVGPDFSLNGRADAEILFNHRRSADHQSYFLVNRRNVPETLEARFRITGFEPELWHAESGLSEPVSYRMEGGQTVVPLSLDAEGSVHVIFRRPTANPIRTVEPPQNIELSRLDGPWTVEFEAERGAPPKVTLEKLLPLNEHSEAGIRYFSGVATYHREFRAPRNWRKGRPLWLDLGEAPEIAEVSVNGVRVAGVWKAPWRVDIGKQVKGGTNRLSVRVANLWVNRFVGDAQPGATKVTWTASPTYTARAPLRRSGLIGPIRLLGEVRSRR